MTDKPQSGIEVTRTVIIFANFQKNMRYLILGGGQVDRRTNQFARQTGATTGRGRARSEFPLHRQHE